MKHVLILLITIAVVFVAPCVQGTAHLSFETNMTANVTRMGCGMTKLCVETPDDCDPEGNNSCLFTSVNGTAGMAPNGTTLYFQLSGGNNTGDRYIAVAITANASEGTSMVFICGRNQTTNGDNGTFFFQTMMRNNTDESLTPTETNVTGIQNLTTSDRIQCEFVVPGQNASRGRAADTTFVVLLGSGIVNGSSLGNFTANVTTAALNLVDPTSNLNNTSTNTSTSSVNITRTGCGTSKLCVETPDDCDPATNNSCLFTSVRGSAGMAPNGTTLYFELSGATNAGDNYIGVALSANASEGTAMLYVCGRNGTTNGTNGTFFFLTLKRNNTDETLTVMNTTATGIQNSTSDTKIQCVFHITGVNASRGRTADTTFVLQVGSGSVNGSSLGNFTANVTTAALNLVDPTSNLNNTNTSSVNITRTGCGTSKLCVETPDDCDPATNDSCLFTSVRGSSPMPRIGTTLYFELSGANNTGDNYIGVALSANASEGTAMLYVCGRNGTTNGTNGTFFFLTLKRNNTDETLTVMNTTATGIQNSTSDTKIQCVFHIPGVNASRFRRRPRTADTTFVLQVGSGSVNGSSLGNFTANVTTAALNLVDPTSNLNNTNTSTSSVNITRTGCGTTKLCVETPDDCDPATNDSCLFTSVMGSAGVAPNGTTLSFELSGANNTGDNYIGVALSANASEGTAMLYVCGRNGTTNGTNGTFFFLTLQRNNTDGALTIMNTTATGIQNSTSDTKIQCVFNITGVNASSTRAADTTFVLQVGSGSVNGSSLGNFTANVTTAALNLVDPTSNLNNTSTSSVNITRTGCGTSKLCVETPNDCDPATNNSCLFTSVNGTAGVAPNGATLFFELSGANNTGDRYVGVALSANASQGTATLYVCGRNGTTNGTDGTFFFLTVQKNNTNGALTIMNTTATGIQNSTSDTKIQCVFNITGVNATATKSNADTTFVVEVGSGTVNGSSLGNFTANTTTAALNLLDPTASGVALNPQVLPLLLSIFLVFLLKTA